MNKSSAQSAPNKILFTIVIMTFVFAQTACDITFSTEFIEPTHDPNHPIYFDGCVVDSTGSSYSNRVVILYIDGVEEKRDITDTENCSSFEKYNLSIEFYDHWGLLEKYGYEFTSGQGGNHLDLGIMKEEETRYFFVQDPNNPEITHEIILWVLAGDSSSISPTRMRLGSGEYQARQVLFTQVKYWTQADNISYDDGYTDLYLTYLSPQLIEAAIDYQAKKQFMPEEEINLLVDEVKMRLRQESSIGFLLRIINDENNPNNSMLFNEQFETRVWLENTYGEQFKPSEYDHIFDYPMSTQETYQGYIFFPKVSDSRVSVDLESAPSIFIRASEIEIASNSSSISRDAMWRFDLVPITFPLEEMASRPQHESTLSLFDILDIISTVLDFISLFGLFP